MRERERERGREGVIFLTWRTSEDIRRVTKNLKKLGVQVIKTEFSFFKLRSVSVNSL
jgi:hypothetical protein